MNISLIPPWVKIVAPIAVAAAIAGGIAYWGHTKYNAGYDACKAEDKTASDAQAVKVITNDSGDEARNEEIMQQQKLEIDAINADKSSLSERLRVAEAALRSSAMREATSERGLDVAAAIAASQKELDRLHDVYDKACQIDAVNYKKLQDEVRPQIR